MGALTLPASGDVYLDANAFIYSVEKIEPYNNLLAPLWHASSIGTLTIVSSDLALLEVLVKPLAAGNHALADGFRELMTNASDVRLIAVDRAVMEHAARLRATTRLKIPDAIHAATALIHGCALFITNDAAFRSISDLNVVILSQVASAAGD